MKTYVTILVLFLSVATFAQNFGVIEGKVLDKELNNEPLVFASIKIKETKQIIESNIDGDYALELKPGIYTLEFNFPGYRKLEVPNIIVKANKITSIENKILGALQIPSAPTLVSLKDK